MKLQFSRVLATLVAQAALNILLASLLYNEYAHNKFMQEYMAGFWTTNGMPVSLGLIVAGVIAGGSVLLIRRQVKENGLKLSQQEQAGPPTGLASLDACPFCNIDLVALSENRFQCRKCHRYFKK